MVYVTVLDFGYTMEYETRSSIDDLAEYVEKKYAGNPEALILAQPRVYAKLTNDGKLPKERLALIHVDQSSTFGLCRGGTYHALKEAKRMIDSGVMGHDPAECSRIVHLVAHSLQVVRAMKQGLLMDLILVPYGEMPEALYDTAAQWWCRGPNRWSVRATLGYLPLKLLRQL